MNDYEFLLSAHSASQQLKANALTNVAQLIKDPGVPPHVQDKAMEAYDKASAEADLITHALIEACGSVAASIDSPTPVG